MFLNFSALNLFKLNTVSVNLFTNKFYTFLIGKFALTIYKLYPYSVE